MSGESGRTILDGGEEVAFSSTLLAPKPTAEARPKFAIPAGSFGIATGKHREALELYPDNASSYCRIAGSLRHQNKYGVAALCLTGYGSKTGSNPGIFRPTLSNPIAGLLLPTRPACSC